mgnify:CR=1 FL=1
MIGFIKWLIQEYKAYKVSVINNITYMDCWSYIAPTIPITEDPISTRIYVMVFKALSDADEREKAEREKK